MPYTPPVRPGGFTGGRGGTATTPPRTPRQPRPAPTGPVVSTLTPAEERERLERAEQGLNIRPSSLNVRGLGGLGPRDALGGQGFDDPAAAQRARDRALSEQRYGEQVASGQISAALANQLMEQNRRNDALAEEQRRQEFEQRQQGLERGRVEIAGLRQQQDLARQQQLLASQRSEVELGGLRQGQSLREQLAAQTRGFVDDPSLGGAEAAGVPESASLRRLLAESEAPVTTETISGDPRVAAFRLAQQRSEERGRAEAAAQFGETSPLESGAFRGELGKLRERRGEAEGAFEAGLLGEEMGARRQARQAALGLEAGELERKQAAGESALERASRERLGRLAARNALRTQLVSSIF